MDRPALGAQGRADGGDVQDIDGATYRTGTMGEGETPFPFEQVHRSLDRELAGLYGADAVPAARQALRDAVAAEGLSAYDRFGADPGAFGEVRGSAAGAEPLGRQLREVEVHRANCVEHGHLIPVESVEGRRSDGSPAQQIGRDLGWLTQGDAEIAMETRGALSERREELVREVERRRGDRRTEAEQRLALVDRSIETIDLIGARQDLAFEFRNAPSGGGWGTTRVTGRAPDGRPVIRMTIAGDRASDVAANRVHELYHAGEFARGRVHVRRGANGPEAAAVDFHSGDEEVAAYRAQFAFDDGSLKRSDYDSRVPGFDRAPRRLADVNRSYVEGLKGQDGRPAYTNLQWTP